MDGIIGDLLRPILVCVVIVLLVSLAGCAHFENQLAPEQLDRGYAIVLPGIEGASRMNSNMAVGLRDGGFDGAVEVVDWTTGHFPLFLIHLRHLERNRYQAREIVDRIIEYQETHPGRPVHLVGHSGGAGMIALILQELPAGRTVTTATLIAAALSAEFPIEELAERTTHGIWSHHSIGDFPLLVIGTTVAGTFDGRHAVSAGAIGFHGEHPNLHQVPYRLSMLKERHPGGHFGCTNPLFISRHVAPILVEAAGQTAD